MTSERPVHPDAHEARARMEIQFAVGGKRFASSEEAFKELVDALDRDPRDAALLGVAVADVEDMLAGLALVDEARWAINFHMDVGELELLSTLRAAGVEWDEVGRRLGYPPDDAAGLAAARWHRLRKRWPNNAAAIDKQLAETEGEPLIEPVTEERAER